MEWRKRGLVVFFLARPHPSALAYTCLCQTTLPSTVVHTLLQPFHVLPLPPQHCPHFPEFIPFLTLFHFGTCRSRQLGWKGWKDLLLPGTSALGSKRCGLRLTTRGRRAAPLPALRTSEGHKVATGATPRFPTSGSSRVGLCLVVSTWRGTSCCCGMCWVTPGLPLTLPRIRFGRTFCSTFATWWPTALWRSRSRRWRNGFRFCTAKHQGLMAATIGLWDPGGEDEGPAGVKSLPGRQLRFTASEHRWPSAQCQEAACLGMCARVWFCLAWLADMRPPCPAAPWLACLAPLGCCELDTSAARRMSGITSQSAVAAEEFN
jgi:hypothetical protein